MIVQLKTYGRTVSDLISMEVLQVECNGDPVIVSLPEPRFGAQHVSVRVYGVVCQGGHPAKEPAVDDYDRGDVEQADPRL